MAKNRAQKSGLLEKYVQLIKENAGFLLVDAEGLDTPTITKFKMALKESGAEYSVIKNSVFKIALQETDQPVEVQNFDGQTGIISYKEDPITAAKLIKELQAQSEMFGARLGTLNGEYIDSQKVQQLADVPSREELLSKLLGSMSSPISGVMNALTGNLKGFTLVLNELSKKEAK